ncbi:MAG: RNA methyltransferase [Solirubrobacterales bacterium]
MRKLRDRKWRDREGQFATEGEDLLTAGIDAGRSPVDVLVAPDSGISGIEVEPELLDAVSTLGSGTRVIAIWEIPGAEGAEGPVVYLEGVGDPGNVGTIVRTAAALTGARLVLGLGCADAYSPKAVRASMGALFAAPPVRGGIETTPSPRVGLVAHGGADLDSVLGELGGSPTLCLGAERAGLSDAAVGACDATATIPLAGGAESLNVAAAAAIGIQRISSLAAAGDHD